MRRRLPGWTDTSSTAHAADVRQLAAAAANVYRISRLICAYAASPVVCRHTLRRTCLSCRYKDIVIFVLKGDVKLELTNCHYKDKCDT